MASTANPATVRLEGLRLLRVAGADRAAFLQGQLTQDVTRAAADRALLAGGCDARGRLLFIAWLRATDDSLDLLVPAALADDVLARLRMFVLRSRVSLSLVPADSAESVAPAGEPDTGERAAIRAGLPVILPATRGEFVPQMVNLDLLDGISFSKGCYTGQEIVARTRYLGRVKRRMLRFSAPTAPPAPGTALEGPRGTAGQVVRAVATDEGCELLAVVILEELPGPLHLGGAALTLRDLPYAIPELQADPTP